ncbi:uncharacterized protein LOC108908303 isoform X2 [Anoplophora glabripennis]|uniref:uncharacterized protein LOC108908303 isoform X2 n=1 Tax=Anoplophora glabripennis TaxID=217634 RepID=UPI00087510D5|nr:uncharacterized protein LOC108908303 isoform X2 [Anoplophora glabripennis]
MTGKLINTPLIRSVALAAAIIGTFQAAIWFSFSLISILLYHSVIEIDTNLSSHNYLRIIYDAFLNPDKTNEDVIVTADAFNIFMYLYVISSFVWLIASLYMMWAMKRNKWGGNFVVISLWSGTTILIAILDVVLMSLVVADYVNIQDSLDLPITPPESPFTTEATSTKGLTTVPSTPEETTLPSSSASPLDTTITTQDPGVQAELMLTKSLSKLIVTDASVFQDISQDEVYKQLLNTSYIILVTLAARGYVLWVINVVLAIILIKFAVNLSKNKTPSLLPMIDGYSTGRPPWGNNLYEQTDIGNGYSNGGFADDNDRTAFPRSDSFVTTEPEGMNQNPLSNGHNPYAQQMENLRPVSDNPNIVSPKVAKIGKQNGRRTPPRNVPPPNIPHSNSPYIPDPDYSPPGSPLKPKSVLRPRSNYVL